MTNWANGTAANNSHSLYLVNPDSPQGPVLLEAAGQASSVITFGSEPEQLDFFWYGGQGQFPGLIRAGAAGYIVYIKEDIFRKVNLSRSDVFPESTQLSSASTRQFCAGAVFVSDPVRPERSLVLVNAPAVDGNCSGTGLRRFALPMDLGANDPPLASPGVILSTLRSGDGGLRGFIVRAGQQVSEMDHRFRLVRNLFTLNSTAATKFFYDGIVRSGILIFSDQDAVKVYDYSAGTEHAVVVGVQASASEVVGWLGSDFRSMLLLDGSGFLKALRISDRSIVSLFAATGATVVEQTESYTVLFADGSSGRKLVRIDMSLNVSTLTDSVFTREVIPACLPAVNRYICQSAGTFLSVDKSGGATKFFLPITDGLIVPVPSTWKLTGDTVWYTVSNGHNRGIRSVLEDGAEDSIDLSRVLYGMVNMKAAQSDLARALFQQDDWKAPYLQTIHKDNGLEIVDGRNHEVVVSYGSLPTLSTPRLIAYVMPFYRAFETGHPQLVQVIGVAPTGTFIELFMVNGNQPGISRVTSFIP